MTAYEIHIKVLITLIECQKYSANCKYPLITGILPKDSFITLLLVGRTARKVVTTAS